MFVALHKGRGWIGKLIQWQTRSIYSHASVLLAGPEGPVIESREFQGVRWLEHLDPAEDVDLFAVRPFGCMFDPARVRQFLRCQLGKPYDYTMVARFISRRSSPGLSEDRWFCSELVFAAFLSAGIRLLARVEPWAVSPGLLAFSPLLELYTGPRS